MNICINVSRMTLFKGKLRVEKTSIKACTCKNLAISVITVENAYGQLAAEGYIYSVPKSGFYVTDLRDDRMKSEWFIRK